MILPLEQEAAGSASTRFWVGIGATFMIGQLLFFFVAHSAKMAQGLSEPQIMTRRQGHDGQIEIIDDYREAYWWLRDQTPEDSRVLAWWDYGYQVDKQILFDCCNCAMLLTPLFYTPLFLTQRLMDWETEQRSRTATLGIMSTSHLSDGSWCPKRKRRTFKAILAALLRQSLNRVVCNGC
mgnify:CR=1 FL=1